MFILHSPLVLHKALVNTDYLFFIQYTPENTLKTRWFLVMHAIITLTFFLAI